MTEIKLYLLSYKCGLLKPWVCLCACDGNVSIEALSPEW